MIGRWWVHSYLDANMQVELISHVFWVIFAICLHELGHGWAALWQGDDTPRRRGHMNMNPLVHMGGMSLLVFALAGIAWGLMPINPSRFRDGRMGSVYVAAAGPAVNIVLAILCLLALILWISYGPSGSPIADNVQIFLFWGAMLNIALAMFNLLPLPPLDGSRILAGFSRPFGRLMESPNAPVISLFILIVVFMSGVGSLLFQISIELTIAVRDFGSDLLLR